MNSQKLRETNEIANRHKMTTVAKKNYKKMTIAKQFHEIAFVNAKTQTYVTHLWHTSCHRTIGSRVYT